MAVAKIVAPKVGYTGTGWSYPGAPAGGYRVTPTVPRATASAAAGAGAGAAPGGGYNFNANQAQIQSLVNRILGQTYTPAQMTAAAKAMTDAQINAAQIGMQTAAKAQQLYTNQQAQRAQGFALALQSLGSGDSDQIAALYNHAAGLMGGLGTSLTGAIGDAQRQTVQGAQNQVSQATGGLGSVSTPYDPTAMQNVAQYTGVVAPASNIYAQGANAGAQALWNNNIAAQHISNIASDYLAQSNLTGQNLALQEAQLQAQRPADYLNAAMQMRQTGLSGLSAALQGLGLAGMYGNYASQQGLRTAQANRANTLTPAQIEQAIARAGQAGSAAALNKAKTAALTGFDTKGNLLPKYYRTAGGAALIPAHYIRDPSDPSGSRIIPDRNNPPSGMIYDPKTSQFIVKPSTAGTSPSSISSMINRGNTGVAAALKTPAYTTLNVAQSAMSRAGGGGPVYGPSGRYTMAQARDALIKANFPKTLWKNSQVINAVNQALRGAGYKPAVAAKKTTTKPIITNPGGFAGIR